MEDESAILKFVSGIDLSRYRSEDIIVSKFSKFEKLKWLKLGSQNLDTLPSLKDLHLLEYVSASKNKIKNLQDVWDLTTVTTLNFRNNQIVSWGENREVDLETTTIDLSYNNITEPPTILLNMPNLAVLNISHNNMTSFDDILLRFNRLVYLDLSYNQISCISEEVFEKHKNLNLLNIGHNLINHQVLIFLGHLHGLVSLGLSSLNLNGSEVDFTNFPSLRDLDISENAIIEFPSSIFSLQELIRLNMSNNQLETVPSNIASFKKLKSLNLSYNKICKLPSEIGELTELTRIYANGNVIGSAGIPKEFANLNKLECLMLAFNELISLPTCICRLTSLKRLSLRNNCLLTLPSSIYDLKLTTLDVKGNPDFVMPKKAPDIADIYDRMDWSYENVRNMVVTLIQQQVPRLESIKEDKIREKIVVHKKKGIPKLEEIQSAESKKFKNIGSKSFDLEETGEEIKKDAIKKKAELQKQASVDVSELFPDNVGMNEGISIFIIDNFTPIYLEDNTGTFTSGDCYIVLNNYQENTLTKYSIFFWIGSKTTIDKRACAAIHSVNLRNLLITEEQTSREEEGDESDDFKRLFPFGFQVKPGSEVPSGFYDGKARTPYTTKMYRIWIHPQKNSVMISSAPISINSLDQRFAYMLSEETRIYLWYGKKCKLTLKNKARLCADKFNRMDRMNRSLIICANESPENLREFFKIIGGPIEDVYDKKSYDDLHISSPVVYQVIIEGGLIGLPQIPLINGKLKQEILQTNNVYIIDCWEDVFIWYGKKSQKMIKEAARRISNQIQKLFTRINCEPTQLIQEGEENYIFKSHFDDWDIIVPAPVKMIEPISKSSEAKLLTHEDFNLPKMEIENIFMPKQDFISQESCDSLLESVEDYLDRMDSFVFENKVFNKLPDSEKGHFYSNECYVFLCKMVIPEPFDEDEDEIPESKIKYNIKYRVFFWEGHNCPKSGFLIFAFTLKRKFEDAFGDKLTVERIKQQQEPLEFLALFHPKFVIHRGGRPSIKNENIWIADSPKLYEIRSTMGMITLRCVEIDFDPRLFCSRLFYILYVPTLNKEIAYLWIGKTSNPNERNAAELIVQSFNRSGKLIIKSMMENEESEEFWDVFGGKKEYDTSGYFLDNVRLFRCSNESGYYAMREKCSDFCQEDLIHDDVMLLDDGKTIFIWEGSNPSDLEVNLTRRLAPIYAQNCKNFHTGKDRKIINVKFGEEPLEFRRLFQGFINSAKKISN